MCDDERLRCLRFRNNDPHLEQLIAEVKKYPCLYAVPTRDYKDPVKKEICWADISLALNRNTAELRKEWKKLRDCYRQALVTRKVTRNDARRKTLKPWKYERQMHFLRPYIRTRSIRLASSSPPSSDCEFNFPAFSTIVKHEIISDDDEDTMALLPTTASHPTPPPASAQNIEPRLRQLRNRIPEQPRTPSIPSPIPQQRFNATTRKRKRDSTPGDPDVLPATANILDNSSQQPEYNALQLFFASMYESTKRLPMRYQNDVKRELLSSVNKAEDEYHATL